MRNRYAIRGARVREREKRVHIAIGLPSQKELLVKIMSLGEVERESGRVRERRGEKKFLG